MANELPRGLLVDLDETILSGGLPAHTVWRRVVDEFTADLAGLDPPLLVEAVGRQLRLWDDPDWNRRWRMRIDEARRLVVAGALAELAASGHRVPGPDIGDHIADRFGAIRDAELCLFPGACEALDRLKQIGVRLALITNGAAGPQRAKVERFALAHRFDHIQIEGEHGFGKPEERAYIHAMERLGVEASETWIVGDNLEWEVEAPQRLGIYAIWYDGYGAGLPPDCPIRPDRIVRSLSELLP